MRPALLAVLAAAATAGAGCGADFGRAEPPTPGSTLDATVVDRDGDGVLERGPGEPLRDRTDLAPRGDAPREAARFAQLTDTHVRDEESPARVPFLDRLGPPVTSTFRPQEALSTQVLASALRALGAERPRALLVTGDLVDSAQANELDQLLAVLRGGAVDPDTGARGYRGVQAAANPDGLFYRPDLDAPRLPGLMGAAQERFFSIGARVRWLPAVGNHDVSVQGELPPSPSTQRIATGDEALLTFDPALRDLVDDLPRRPGAATPDLRDVPRPAIEQLLAGGVPGDTASVPADPRRRHLTGDELLARLRGAARLPAGGDRLDFSVDLPPGVRAIVLDTTDRAGGQQGVLRRDQVAFLRRALDRAGDRSIVVVDHHGLDRVRGGKAALALLDRDDRVVAELCGDRHRNEIRPVRTRAGGFWRITTSSLADWPQQGRMLRVLTGADGSRAVETWMVDHAGGVGEPRVDDLPGAARSLAHLDAQGGRPNGLAGAPADRNARLWLPPR